MIGYASNCFEFFGLVGWLRMILWCIVDSCDWVTWCLCWKGSTKALCEDKPARQQEIVLMTLEPPAPGPVWVLRVGGCAQQSFDHLMIWWAIFCTCGRINHTPKEAWFLQTRNYPRNYTKYILLPFPIFSYFFQFAAPLSKVSTTQSVAEQSIAAQPITATEAKAPLDVYLCLTPQDSEIMWHLVKNRKEM